MHLGFHKNKFLPHRRAREVAKELEVLMQMEPHKIRERLHRAYLQDIYQRLQQCKGIKSDAATYNDLGEFETCFEPQ